MDRRYYDESQQAQGGAPPQHSPDDVLLWLDSLSGQAPDPAGSYTFSQQWLSEQAYPPMPAQPYPQGSSHYPQGIPQQYPPGVAQQYQPGAPQHYPQGTSQQYPHGSSHQYPQGQPQQYPTGASQQFQQGSSAQPQPIAYGADPQGYDDYDYEGSSHGSYSETESAAAKRKIALDPSQPLTVDGKPRARVFVACDRCRVRKLRCDGAKPACYHCQKVAHTGVECKYDPTPKRRGQDKAPRTRSAVGTRLPRRPAVKKGDREGGAGGSQPSQGSGAERR